MNLAVVVGVGIVAFFFFIFGKTIDDKQHKFMKNFLYIISFIMLMIIPASLVLDQTVCEVVLNSSDHVYVYGNNFTGYHWDYDYSGLPASVVNEPYLFHEIVNNTYDSYCYTKSNGSKAFYKSTLIIYIIFIIYLGFLFVGDNIKRLMNSVRKI